MSYNPYGAPQYGPPPTFGGFPGSGNAPGMAPPPGLGPPPGMSSAPGMAPPPGVQQSGTAAQANRPSGLPPSFQPPPNLPNINFNAPVIRLGAASLPSKPGNSAPTGRRDADTMGPGGAGRAGGERGLEQARANMRETMQSLVPPSNEEKLRTIFIHKIPKGLGGDSGVERLLGAVGRLRRWDSAKSHLEEHKGDLFGFAQFEDAESLEAAVELLNDVSVPAAKQAPSNQDRDTEDGNSEADEIKLQVVVDENTLKYLEAVKEDRDSTAVEEVAARLETARSALRSVLHEILHPADGDQQTGDSKTADGQGSEDVEVINIPLAQEDDLSDIPAEMREVVAGEIAAFRERSNRRDLERLRREEEMEEQERQRNGVQRLSRNESPSHNSNSIPVGPRGINAPSGPRGSNATGRTVPFVNGGMNGDSGIEEDNSDASDEELLGRELAQQRAEAEKQYLEAERKWVNRERQRAAALEREDERDRDEVEGFAHRREEQLARERSWDDERELARRGHPYYRDHATWARKRAQEKASEESRDEADRRAEHDERRRRQAEEEKAKGLADSFLDKQAEEMGYREPEASSAPQRFTISFGAAAQKAQAQRTASRRTVAEVEGLLDDEEQDVAAKRQLVPIQFDSADASAMSEEEISKAVRALAQEIPTEKAGLWEWEVKWDFLDDAIITDKLRPFVEKKVVEYLGVQEQFLVEMVESHLRKHAPPGDLAEELSGPLDEDAEDLVKKLWRMVIFFTESEKRGLPA